MIQDPWDPREFQSPAIPVTRLLVVGTGSVSAMFLPYWLNWLRHVNPTVQCQVVLTRSAQRFVAPEGVGLLTGRPVLTDAWTESAKPRALHVELAAWAEAIAVYPASMQYLARLALGMADTPTLLAAQCSTAPIALAAALPPGGWTSPAMRRHREALAGRPNTAVLPPVAGTSMSSGNQDGNQVDSFPALLALLARLCDTPVPASPAVTAGP
jgi:phosphopantothenoylcysteine decarboxylase/phosphopantothenate--cysteine ligase